MTSTPRAWGWRIAWMILAAMAWAVLPIAAQDVTLKNDFIGIGVNDLGSFRVVTTGGSPLTPEDDNKPLTFFYTVGKSGNSTFPLLNVDGSLFNLTKIAPKIPPYIDGNGILCEWDIQGITVTQRILIVKSFSTNREDVCQIRYTIRNFDADAHQVGLRLVLDTRIGTNDVAPIYISGEPFNPYEKEFRLPNIPQYWQAFQGTVGRPGLTAQGTLWGEHATPPDRLAFMQWSAITDQTWDLEIDRKRRIYDSSVIFWFNPLALEKGAVREISTYYGLGSGAAQGEYLSVNVSAPTKLTVVDGQLSPNPFQVNVLVKNVTKRMIPGITLILDSEYGLQPEAGGPSADTLRIGDLKADALADHTFRITATPGDSIRTLVYHVTAICADPSIPPQKVEVAVRIPTIFTSIDGRVVDARTHKPIPATIKVERETDNKVEMLITCDSTSGVFRKTLLSGQVYNLIAEYEDHAFTTYKLDLTNVEGAVHIPEFALSLIEKDVTVVLHNIYFDFGKADLRPESIPEMERLVGFMAKYKTVRIEIAGHADSIGNDAVNQALSKSRAEAVKAYLTTHAISDGRITTVGYGRARPVSSNLTEEGRALNRRTEFKIISK